MRDQYHTTLRVLGSSASWGAPYQRVNVYSSSSSRFCQHQWRIADAAGGGVEEGLRAIGCVCPGSSISTSFDVFIVQNGPLDVFIVQNGARTETVEFYGLRNSNTGSYAIIPLRKR